MQMLLYSLNLIQKAFNLLRLLKVRLEYGWRGCPRETLSDHQDTRVLKGIEDLAAKKTTGSSNKDCGRHLDNCLGEAASR